MRGDGVSAVVGSLTFDLVLADVNERRRINNGALVVEDHGTLRS